MTRPRSSPEAFIERRGNREFKADVDGNSWTRRIKPDASRTEWTPVSPPPKEPEKPANLIMLILEAQAEGEPKHWSLFVGEENQPGLIFSVTGDATYMVRKSFESDVNIFASQSYFTSYVLGRLDDDGSAAIEVIKRCVEEEKPPRAENRAAVKENCQGWTLRVIKRLHEEGLVAPGAVTLAEALLEPV